MPDFVGFYGEGNSLYLWAKITLNECQLLQTI